MSYVTKYRRISFSSNVIVLETIHEFGCLGSDGYAHQSYPLICLKPWKFGWFIHLPGWMWSIIGAALVGWLTMGAAAAPSERAGRGLGRGGGEGEGMSPFPDSVIVSSMNKGQGSAAVDSALLLLQSQFQAQASINDLMSVMYPDAHDYLQTRMEVYREAAQMTRELQGQLRAKAYFVSAHKAKMTVASGEMPLPSEVQVNKQEDSPFAPLGPVDPTSEEDPRNHALASPAVDPQPLIGTVN